MSKIHWLIDAGHGGIDKDGKYVTAPSKMFKFKDGFTIYEGQVNRVIAKHLYGILHKNNIGFSLLYDDVLDTPLWKRIAIANKIFAKDPTAVSVSIHSNASPNPDKPGSGFEIWTKPGKDASDTIAEVFCSHFQASFPHFKFRTDKSDGDLDKEGNLAMVGANKKTPLHCPAILLENLFMDNRAEAEYLCSESGPLQIANCIARAIVEIEGIRR